MTHYSSCEAAIAAAAKGDAEALIWGFVWWESAEGEVYWLNQWRAGHVTPAAKHKLRLKLRRIRQARAIRLARLPKAVGLTEFLMPLYAEH